MATHIEGVSNTPAFTRKGKPNTETSEKQTIAGKSENRKSAGETAHTVELSPESVSKAQKMVTGSGYITSSDLEDIDFTDEQALDLSVQIARQLKTLSGGMLQPPAAELTGMVG